MSTAVSVDQLKALWKGEISGGMIERGDDYAPVAREDIGALIDGGVVDCDEDGNPLEDDWAVIADQFASDQPGEPTGGPQEEALQAITDAVRETVLAAIDSAPGDPGRRRPQDLAKGAVDEGIRQAVLAAIDRRTPVTAIANALEVTRARVYQIRDGRR